MTMDWLQMDHGDTAIEPTAGQSVGGPEEASLTGRMRRCIVSREVLPKENLIRFVVGPDGLLVPDVEGKLPGRGLWVKAGRATLESAIVKNAFSKAARRQVGVPGDLVDLTVMMLRRRCLELVGLARRAGRAVAGFERVRAELSRQNTGVLLTAADGAEDGKRKLKGLAEGVRSVTLFTSAELSHAFGRENVVHAAVMPGRLADLFCAETSRLAGVCGTSD